MQRQVPLQHRHRHPAQLVEGQVRGLLQFEARAQVRHHLNQQRRILQRIDRSLSAALALGAALRSTRRVIQPRPGGRMMLYALYELDGVGLSHWLTSMYNVVGCQKNATSVCNSSR